MIERKHTRNTMDGCRSWLLSSGECDGTLAWQVAARHHGFPGIAARRQQRDTRRLRCAFWHVRPARDEDGQFPCVKRVAAILAPREILRATNSLSLADLCAPVISSRLFWLRSAQQPPSSHGTPIIRVHKARITKNATLMTFDSGSLSLIAFVSKVRQIPFYPTHWANSSSTVIPPAERRRSLYPPSRTITLLRLLLGNVF